MDDRIYRKVEIDVWEASDFRALSRPKPNAQTLWLWLLSCPRTVAIPGVIKGRLSAMAGDLEWPLRSFRKCLDEIVAAGMAEVDETAGLVVLTRALLVDGKPRPTAQPRTKNTAKAWGDAFIKLPSCALLDSLTARLRAFFDQIGGEIANVFAERVGWSTAGASGSPPVEQSSHHRTQRSEIRDQGSSDHTHRAREGDPPKPSGDTHAALVVELHDAWVTAGRALTAEIGLTAKVGGALPDSRHLEMIRVVVGSWSVAAAGEGRDLREVATERMRDLIAVRVEQSRSSTPRSVQYWAAPTFWSLDNIERDLAKTVADVRARAARAGPPSRSPPTRTEPARTPIRTLKPPGAPTP